jgi:hypothetical protein
MDWVGWLQVVLAVVAVTLGLAVLIPAAYQAYLDRCAKWPYETPFIGRLRDPIGPWMITLAFRFDNLTTREAFFEVGYTLPADTRRFYPDHISVWPSMEKVGYWVSVPPKSSREIRVEPFGLNYLKLPEAWVLTILEYRHRTKPIVLEWPKDLDRLVDMVATDIPPPTS